MPRGKRGTIRFLGFPVGGRMHYYLDAEFNGFGGSLISLALVPKDRLLVPFYEALPCLSPVPWVVEHVLPVLRTRAISRSEMSVKLSSFLSNDLDPVIVSDWPEDIAQLAMLMITGPGWRLPSPRLTFVLLDLPLFSSETESDAPHNPCHDAVALRDYVQTFIAS
jgi:hypothetical protein